MIERPLQEMLRFVLAELEEDGWDQPPTLSILYREPVVLPELLGELYKLEPFPSWETAGERVGYNVRNAVLALTMVCKEMPVEFVKEHFAGSIGLVLASETWFVAARTDSTIADREEALQVALERVPPSEHPDRREARMVTIVTPHGVASRFQPREGEPIEESDDLQFGGALVDALQALLAATVERASA